PPKIDKNTAIKTAHQLKNELDSIRNDINALQKTKIMDAKADDLENFSLAIEGLVSTNNLDGDRAYRNLERIFWLKDSLTSLENQVNLLQSRYNEIESSGQMTPAFKQ